MGEFDESKEYVKPSIHTANNVEEDEAEVSYYGNEDKHHKNKFTTENVPVFAGSGELVLVTERSSQYVLSSNPEQNNHV